MSEEDKIEYDELVREREELKGVLESGKYPVRMKSAIENRLNNVRERIKQLCK